MTASLSFLSSFSASGSRNSMCKDPEVRMPSVLLGKVEEEENDYRPEC